LQKLDGVFFDLDDTLYSCTHFAKQARRNAIRSMLACGMNYPEDKLMEELELVTEEFSSNYEKHFDKLLLRIPREAWHDLNPAILVAAAVIGYHNTKMRDMFPYEDAVDLLERLSRTTVVRGVITAGPPMKQAEKIIRLGLMKFLSPNAVFITEQIGITKRNPRLYQLACESHGLKPARVMYVGDRGDYDIDVPNSIGMITVHSKRSGKYAEMPSQSKPTYVINNFYDLMDILQNDFDLPILRRRQ
jgi:putative hydrolase of the HAD superfamily